MSWEIYCTTTRFVRALHILPYYHNNERIIREGNILFKEICTHHHSIVLYNQRFGTRVYPYNSGSLQWHCYINTIAPIVWGRSLRNMRYTDNKNVPRAGNILKHSCTGCQLYIDRWPGTLSVNQCILLWQKISQLDCHSQLLLVLEENYQKWMKKLNLPNKQTTLLIILLMS